MSKLIENEAPFRKAKKPRARRDYRAEAVTADARLLAIRMYIESSIDSLRSIISPTVGEMFEPDAKREPFVGKLYVEGQIAAFERVLARLGGK